MVSRVVPGAAASPVYSAAISGAPTIAAIVASSSADPMRVSSRRM